MLHYIKYALICIRYLSYRLLLVIWEIVYSLHDWLQLLFLERVYTYLERSVNFLGSAYMLSTSFLYSEFSNMYKIMCNIYLRESNMINHTIWRVSIMVTENMVTA